MPNHGEYQPGNGFFDASRNGWIKDPAKLSELREAKPITATQADQIAGWNDKSFKEDPEKEAMIRLRDSNRPEDREKFDRLFSGSQRAAIAGYEDQKRNS